MVTLTKENFWDEMSQKYPKATAHFKLWVDQYKSEHDWASMFGHLEYKKYHELPIAMQFGIFLEYLDYMYFNNLYYVQSVGIRNPKATIQSHLQKLEGNL